MFDFKLELGPFRIALSLGKNDGPGIERYDYDAYSTHERAPMGFAGYCERPDFGHSPEGGAHARPHSESLR